MASYGFAPAIGTDRDCPASPENRVPGRGGPAFAWRAHRTRDHLQVVSPARLGSRARVAVARKLAVILHRMWSDRTASA